MRYDLRQPRKFDPRDVKVLIVDSNRFQRGLMSEIMRTVSIMEVATAKSDSDAIRALDEYHSTVVFVEWSEFNEDLDPPELTRKIRSLYDDHSRRVPVIAMSSQLTKEQLIEGRNAGMDEFLKKPCSPNDVIGRLKMVIETPRPFVDSKSYVGPCRRRKNPADYHGARRRADDDINAVKAISDAERDMMDKENPFVAALDRLKVCCTLLIAEPDVGRGRTAQALKKMREIAKQENDGPYLRALTAFELYLLNALRAKALDRKVMKTGISTLEQLIVLPNEFAGARETIASAFQDAIERKMTAAAA